MLKNTSNITKRKKKNVSGFLKRNSTSIGQKILKNRRKKKRYII